MLSPPAQEDVAAAGEDGGELKVKTSSLTAYTYSITGL